MGGSWFQAVSGIGTRIGWEWGRYITGAPPTPLLPDQQLEPSNKEEVGVSRSGQAWNWDQPKYEKWGGSWSCCLGSWELRVETPGLPVFAFFAALLELVSSIVGGGRRNQLGTGVTGLRKHTPGLFPTLSPFVSREAILDHDSAATSRSD